MNIFHKVALQGLLKNRTRSFVTVIGVVLSTAMFTAIVTFGTSLVNYLICAEIARGGNWHVVFSGVDASRIQEWEKDKEVSGMAYYENQGYAILEGAGEDSAQKPYLFLAGFQDETFDYLPVKLISGRLPEDGGEILIPDHIAVKAGVRIRAGDILTLAVGSRERDGRILTQCDPYRDGEALTDTQELVCTVVGTYERPGFEPHSSPGYTVITRTHAQEPRDGISLFLTLRNPRRAQAYGEERRGEGSFAINENLLRFMGVSDNKLFNALLLTIGGILALIVMTGSVFLIYNSFHISLNERVHQFGILMSVGATSRQLLGSVLFEGLCIGFMGIPFGILTGIVCIRLILPVVAKNFAGVLGSSVPLALSISAPALITAVLLSLAVILISAYIPAKKASSTPVMECIRLTGEIKTQAKAVRISGFAWKIYGLEGALAMKNFKRNRRRCRSIVLSLSLSVILVVTGGEFGAALKGMAKELTGQKADGDISFMTQDMTQDEFLDIYDMIKDSEGIYRSTWQADLFYLASTGDLPDDFLAMYREAAEDDSEGNTQELILYSQFIEDDIYYEFVESLGLPVEEYRGENAKVLACAVDAKEHTTFFTGSSMSFTLVSPGGGKAKTVCATFEDAYPLDMAFVFDKEPAIEFFMTAPLSLQPQFEDIEPLEVSSGALFWSETPSLSLSRIQTALMEEGVMAAYDLYNLSQAFELFRNLSFVVDVFTGVFVVMLSLIAVANVFNTISTGLRLRRRELAMLRSVGMSDRGFNRMMNFECAIYGVRSLLIGIPVSALLSLLIHKAFLLAERRDDIAFSFPWGAMAVSVLGVFGIVFITMLYAADKIRKENIIDALRDETG